VARSGRAPSYRRQNYAGGRATAFIEIRGQRIYLGRYGTPESKEKYRRILAEIDASGPTLALAKGATHNRTINELLVLYWEHAAKYYVKDGKPTSEQASLKAAFRPLSELYGGLDAQEFGPKGLTAVRQVMIARRWTRKSINKHVNRIVRFFKWAVGQEFLAAEVWKKLQAVDGLRSGRTAAADPQPIKPVSDQTVEQTLPFLSPAIAAMVRFQQLAGCRPSEVCALRPADIDRSGDVWEYRPESHKTQHHDRARVIFIGPRAQEILLPYLLRHDDSFCFAPSKGPRRSPLDRYDTAGYRRRIAFGCDRAFPPPAELAGAEKLQWQKQHRWSPNRLRHSCATELRKQFGLDVASIVLGHKELETTQVYAERDLAAARAAMRSVG
jgi:integrase